MDESKSAKEALNLIMAQEATKGKEAEARGKEYEAHVKSLEIQRIQKVRDVSVFSTSGGLNWDTFRFERT